MSTKPGLTPPPGIVSNFDNPPDENGAAHATLAICLVVSTVAIILRIYARFFVLRKPFLGDYILITAYGLFLGDIALVYFITESTGLFVHQWDIRLSELSSFLHYTFNATNIFSIFVMLVKTAILLEWIRIFSPPGARGFVFWSSHALILANVLFYVLIIILVNLSCVPYEFNWNRTIKGDCSRVNTGWTNLSSACINFITDVFILAIPQRAIWKLHMSSRKKVGVAVVFAIGILGIVSAACRVAVTTLRATSKDFTYTFSAVMLCALAEGTCSILVVCGPAMPKAVSIVPKATLAMRSWVGESVERLRGVGGSSSRNATSQSSRTWPRGGGSLSASIKAKSSYTDIEGDANRHAAAAAMPPPMPLSKLRPVVSSVQRQPEHYDPINDSERGIVHNTRFETTEEYDANGTTNDDFVRQHPWAKKPE
ncbi:hypothetical protein B0T17DRAFT_594652 [Bombardia bombarda]|uniref:Rhodopsin domain-containing protein n=1 Tax=Bombardia bombarda TaxID=252184 RepID=A0AA39XIZ0_9PEZI|nr:hypothetical protein B0T17DRAFT_594652 [Bombardia bombarda]